jgi:hypothetical protein
MKINPDFHIPEAARVKDGGKAGEVSGSSSFSSLLDQMSSEPSSVNVQEPGVVPDAPPMFQNAVTSAEHADALAAGEQALELIEHLEAMLTGSGNSDAGVGSVASALEDTTRDLVQIRDSLDAQDPLRGAIDEIGILSVVASMKIERGDFSF